MSMSKTVRLIELFNEIANETDWKIEATNKCIRLYKQSPNAIISAYYNKKGPTLISIYSDERGYEVQKDMVSVRKGMIIKIINELT